MLDTMVIKCFYTILGISQRFFRILRTYLRILGAERPTTTLLLVISSCITVLPFVTATALMPLSILLDLSNALCAKGLFYVLYTVFFQGTILAVIITVLFIFTFMVATGATIIHKYSIRAK